MFHTNKTPANDIHTLRDHLMADAGDIKYAYRGQVTDYDMPLVPSRYRQHISYSDHAVKRGDALSEHSIKKIGNKYYGDYVENFEKYKLSFLGNATSEEANLFQSVYYKALSSTDLLFSQQGFRILSNSVSSRLDLIRSILNRQERQVFDLFRDKWLPRINNHDRRIIRNFAFYKPLGYILGTALAQQYGFSSEGLDATKDIDIACFFATHDSKDYYSEPCKEGVGVIYRFPYDYIYDADNGAFQYQFYSPHSLIDIDEILSQMTRNDIDTNGFYDSFANYFQAAMRDAPSDHNLLRMPAESYGSNRISRQKAVVILPDEIREDDETSELSIIGTHLPKYQYIEDIATRDGVVKYYFRHSEKADCHFSREHFWPRDDPLLHLVVWTISSICQRTFGAYRHVIPYRLDLIDGGYNQGEFLNTCMKIAEERLTLISENKIIAGTDNMLHGVSGTFSWPATESDT